MHYRTCLLLAAAACFTGANLHAADDALLGKWKIDFGKSKTVGFQAKIEDIGNHEMNFIFGDDTETYHFDGKEHPTRYGSVRTLSSVTPDQWKSVTKRDGKTTSTDLWTLADGGKTLTVTSEGNRPDGTDFKQEFAYKRVAGTSGLAGTWESTKIDPGSYPDWLIESHEGGLAFVFPAFKERHAVKFDGKDYPAEGPRVAPGSTTAGKRVDEHTVELTDKLKGKVMDTMLVQASADGKTMTVTITYPGMEQKEVDVYQRP